MPTPTTPLWGQIISNGINNIRNVLRIAKERYNSMSHEQKAEAARVGDQWVKDNVSPVVTTVGELIPQTSIPMAAYNTSEAVKQGNYNEAFQHALTPVLTGSVFKGINLGLKASEKAIDSAGRTLKNIGKETKATIPIEKPMAKTIFRANVYKGGEIADPYNSFFTTDPEYAAQYGPVKQYIIEGKNPSVAKEPLMGYRDPATMDLFVYRNIDNPESTIIIGKDVVTKDIPYQSKGIEILSYGKNNIQSVQEPKEITLDKAVNAPYSGTNYVFHGTPVFLKQFAENESRAIVPSFGVQRLSQLKKYLKDGKMNAAELYPEYKFIGGKDILEGAKLYADDAGTVSVLDAGYTQDQYIPSRQRQAVTDYLLKQSNWKDAKQISLKDLAEIDIPEYAEAKYPGLFELTKFPYALFPENTSKLNRDAIKFFQDKGVKIKLYTPTTRGKVGDFNEVLQELLEEHPDILFKQGGKIKSVFNPQQ